MIQEIPIFVINLKKDTDRKQYVENLCELHKLQCQFIEAIYGNHLDENTISKVYDKDKSIQEHGRELTKNEIGCALSHLSVYERMIEQNIKMAIIFEDDIQIVEGFSSVMQSIDKFPNDWELVLFGYHRGGVDHKITKSSVRFQKKITIKHRLVRLVRIGLGSYGYLINLHGAKKLVKELSIIKKPIDYHTGSDTYLNLYAISPRIIGINDIYTEQSSLEIERNLTVDKYNNISNKKKRIKIKFIRELARPFIQLIKQIKLRYDQIKTLKKYT